jgi:hypothetical protein
VLATSAHQNYHQLVVALAELGFLSVPADLADLVYPNPRPGLSKRLEAITVNDIDPPIEVHYLQPLATEGDTCIDFATFVSYVERYDDAMSALFASHLRRWTTPAGSERPTRIGT